jgi:two-component system NtrC family sensor kinase
MRSIALRLMSSYLVIIVIISAVFSFVGIRFIDERVVAETQRRVNSDLNAARFIYNDELHTLRQVVRLTADRILLRDALRGVSRDRATVALADVLRREQLDVLLITNARGVVLWRPGNPGHVGDSRAGDPLVRAALDRREATGATVIVPVGDLRREGPLLETRARFELVPTPRARERPERELSAGMMLAAAAPIVGDDGTVLGAVYGAVLLNQRHDLADRIKQVVFEDAVYRGKSVGTSTLFLDDVRIATNVLNSDGTRAIGTRAAADVYERVVREGRPWVGRAFVVNDWYISAYEPIRSIGGDVVGMLYVGTLEAPYLEMKRRSTLVFLAITLSGAVLTIGLSYLMSRRLSIPLQHLVVASRRLAHGDLDTAVEPSAVAEFAELAESFDAMAAALKARDAKLHESARRRMMESERLAIIGKLAADVAHELNNPLQGIVTFAHLLRERVASDERSGAWADKIVTQAERCRLIIRSLLDFSRPRKPVVKPASVNALLVECLSLVENQAVFQNIEIVRRLDPNVPEVVIDPSLMQQVFMNLVLNAADAMNGGGRLTLTTRFDAAEGMVETEFADTGCGVPEENLDRLFEPFFSTKPVGKGAGLGLSICFGIVKEHHGTISVESEAGRGATFVVQLPVRPAEAAA